MKLFVFGIVALMLQLQPPAKGSIEGVVMRAGSGEPIPGGRMILGNKLPANTPPPCALPSSPIGLPTGPSIVSDSQGRFSFRDLEAGSYCVGAGANGYARQVYGSKGVTLLGTPINVNAGQTVREIVIPLTPTGSISGRVRDNAGQPVAGIQVQALKAIYSSSGQRTFQSVGSGHTDDRGEYRMYWITPGRYYVFAGNLLPGLQSASSSPNEIPVDGIAPVFYPNSSDAAQAVVIDLKPSGDVGGVDFVLPRQMLFRIRGRIIDARGGASLGNVNITLVTILPTGTNFSNTSSQSYNPQDGTFELKDVVPGLHLIRAQSAIAANTVTPSTAGLISTNIPGTAQMVVNLTSDLNGLVLAMVNGASLPGQLAIEGPVTTVSTGLERVRFQLRPSLDGILTQNLGGPTPVTQATNADGAFRIDSVLPGEYRLGVVAMPPEFYIKQARFNPSDILNEPMRFSAAESGTVEILLSSRGGQIDGSVEDDKQRAVRDVQAVLVPDRNRDRIDLYKTATTDSSGRFSIRGVAPGDYRLFAWEDVEPYSWFDPEVIKTFESQGRPMHVSESSKSSVALRIIPVP